MSRCNLRIDGAIELFHLINIFGIGIKRLPDVLVFDGVSLAQLGVDALQFGFALCNNGLRLLGFAHLPANKIGEDEQGNDKQNGDDGRGSQGVALAFDHAIAVLFDDGQDATHLDNALACTIEVGILQRLAHIFGGPLNVALLIKQTGQRAKGSGFAGCRDVIIDGSLRQQADGCGLFVLKKLGPSHARGDDGACMGIDMVVRKQLFEITIARREVAPFHGLQT